MLYQFLAKLRNGPRPLLVSMRVRNYKKLLKNCQFNINLEKIGGNRDSNFVPHIEYVVSADDFGQYFKID